MNPETDIELNPLPETLWSGDGGLLLPPSVTTNSASVDVPFYLILGINILVLAFVAGLTLYFFIRYRRRHPGQMPPTTAGQSSPIPLMFGGIAMVLVFDVFYLGFQGFLDLAQAPAHSMLIDVAAEKWSWSFAYPNGHVDKELHVPVNQPVKLRMKSADLVHSFAVPAFRLKQGVLPDRQTTAWFEANRPGEYIALSSEYSGPAYSNMWTRVIVHQPGEYETWLEGAADPFKTMTSLQVGEKLFTKFACITCHSVDGSAKTGPTLKGLFGRTTKLASGSTVVADDAYVLKSIVEPQADIVESFAPAMPAYQGLIKERELNAIIEYLKTQQ